MLDFAACWLWRALGTIHCVLFLVTGPRLVTVFMACSSEQRDDGTEVHGSKKQRVMKVGTWQL